MNEQKIKEVFADEAFVASILEMESPEEVQKALSEKGLELNLEEIHAIQNALSTTEGELCEDELENVAGGISPSVINIIRPMVPQMPIVRPLPRRRW